MQGGRGRPQGGRGDKCGGIIDRGVPNLKQLVPLNIGASPYNFRILFIMLPALLCFALLCSRPKDIPSRNKERARGHRPDQSGVPHGAQCARRRGRVDSPACARPSAAYCSSYSAPRENARRIPISRSSFAAWQRRRRRSPGSLWVIRRVAVTQGGRSRSLSEPSAHTAMPLSPSSVRCTPRGP